MPPSGPRRLVFVSLLYAVTPTDVLQMMQLLWSSWSDEMRAAARWPFVPTQAQRTVLFPHGPYNLPWHSMAEVIMTKALEWCREHHAVTMTDEVFRTIVEQAEAA